MISAFVVVWSVRKSSGVTVQWNVHRSYYSWMSVVQNISTADLSDWPSFVELKSLHWTCLWGGSVYFMRSQRCVCLSVCPGDCYTRVYVAKLLCLSVCRSPQHWLCKCWNKMCSWTYQYGKCTDIAADRWPCHWSAAISVHCTKAVYTVTKCFWRWASLSPETCRTNSNRSIKRSISGIGCLHHRSSGSISSDVYTLEFSHVVTTVIFTITEVVKIVL